ncbi:uncharacterized protein PGRI_084900 [Penicillium griseofulvum]|uniref:Uncharacterized protein n=1 Tax=Penicillium patulum TaxID=5078 RepID=A0A135LTE8_PENPA|nr:uncharacterized protein PGRI_084900 [Penicillium griseofulvum]KXG52206.1 hypothetical protein PGRI_084900 [Penicillium griseofulvum]
MVLDPSTSLAVVGIVIQFVDAGCKLFSKSREFYKSTTGALADDIELQSIARQLEELAGSARFLPSLSDSPGASRGEKLLLEISQGCQEQAKKLDDILRPLRTSEASAAIPLLRTTDDHTTNKKWEAFRFALRRMRKSGEIDRIAKRLDTYGQQLNSCLTMIFCDQNSTIWKSMQQFYGLNSEQSTIFTSQAPAIRETNEGVQKQLKSISQALNSMRDYNAENEGLKSWIRFRTSNTDGFDETIANLEEWLKASENLARQLKLLDSLSYRAIQERHSQIRESHTQTFEWAFDTQLSADKLSQSSVYEWQKSGDGIFWVSGKAGSGKSTLMKFLCNHSLTHRALRLWAGRDQLMTASFFFWNSGTTLQKSQEGLIRSLLHEILQKHPALIEQVFPSESHEESEGSTNSKMTNMWSRSQLINAFHRLANQKISSSKFCFFIDGLDEYQGDHVELVNLLCKLVHCNENVKIMVSSRPWNAFQVAFGDGKCSSLRLEDLTRNDISLYVRSKLEEHNLYRKCIREKTLEGINLVHEVVKKANGVFLWVYLVVRSLQRGLENDDRLPELHRRLQAIPTDLEMYFGHMLENIDPLYKFEAAKCFDIALQSKRALTLLTFSFLDEEEPVQLALASPIKQITLSEVKSRHQTMAKRLNARCQDLLEIITEKEFPNTNTRVICSSGSNETFAAPKDFQLYRVDFLHRTVRDFLNAAEMREIFSSRLPPTFDSATWLCASFVQQLKSALVKERSSDFDLLFVTLFDNAMHFARESEIREHNPRSQTDLLDELERVGAIFYKNIGPKFLKIFLDFRTPDTVSGWAKRFEEIYLEICVKKDLLIYVRERLDEGPESENLEQINSLLLCALFPRTMQKPTESGFEVPNPRMVQLILDKGGSPNWSYGQNTTTWLCFINFLARSWANTGINSRKVLLSVIKQLLDYGAAISSERGPKAAWVEFLIMDGSNWEYRGDSEEFQAMLCDLVDITAARVDVNICHKGCTVWGHFVNNLPEKMARRTKLRILRTIQTFLRNGADPYFDYTAALVEYDPRSKQRGEQPIGSKLLQNFTESELVSCGMPLDSIQVLESIESDRFRSSTASQTEIKSGSWWTNVPKLWKWGGG